MAESLASSASSLRSNSLASRGSPIDPDNCRVCYSYHTKLRGKHKAPVAMQQMEPTYSPVRVDALQLLETQSWKDCPFCAALYTAYNKFYPRWQEIGAEFLVSRYVEIYEHGQNIMFPTETIMAVVYGPEVEFRDAVEFFALDDEPPAWDGLGALKEPMSGVDDIATYLRDLLATCKSAHQECMQQDQVALPKRVLDVSSDSKRARLYETGGAHGQYTALSHCWGKVQLIKTEKATLKQHLDGIDLDRLPPTFQEAIAVTRMLGLHYIWIDSLCIIQDSAEDWEIESAKMSAVYRNAELTIMAGASSSSAERFLTQRQSPLRISASISEASVEDGPMIGAVATIDGETYPISAMSTAPLSLRGWVLQEEALSRRLAMFTTRGIYWQCTRGVIQETHPNGNRKYERSLDINQLEPANAFAYWRRLVMAYSRRSLTFGRDKLPAISGLAYEIQQITGSRYYAGIWENDLLNCLSWISTTYDEDTSLELMWDNWATIPQEYVAPSWSWASVIGLLGFNKMRANARSLIFSADISVHVSSVNAPLGRVTDGVLTVSALSLPVIIKLEDWSVLDDNQIRPDIAIQAFGKEEILRPDAPIDALEFIDETGAKRVSACRARGWSQRQHHNVEGLCLINAVEGKERSTWVLGNSPNRQGHFRRLGWLQVKQEKGPKHPWLVHARKRVIHIE